MENIKTNMKIPSRELEHFKNLDLPKFYEKEINNSSFSISIKNSPTKYLYDELTDTTTEEDLSDIEYSKNKKEQFRGKAKDFHLKYKTELCKYYECNGYCKYGEYCAYAHGKENLRSKITNTIFFRTKKCESFFKNGYCPYGSRCQFAHQFHTNIINNPYDKKMTYEKILDTINKIENIDNIKILVKKPRLQCFKEIIKNKNQSESTLLYYIKELKRNNFKID